MESTCWTTVNDKEPEIVLSYYIYWISEFLGNVSYFLFLFAADLAQELHQAVPDPVSALW